MEPFEIYKDNLVRVTTTLVDHYELYPAFAFRFDTDDGSLVISGDTGPNPWGNLQKLAKGADVLVHEVINNLWLKAKFGGMPEDDPEYPLYIHMITAHTSSIDVGKVAEQCGVRPLILSHIAPSNATPPRSLEDSRQFFSGQVIAGKT